MSSRLSTDTSWPGGSGTLHRIRFRELGKYLYTGVMPGVDPSARVHRPTECARSACGKTLPPAKAVGRPRLYCSPTCEQLAHREQRINRLAERRAQQLTAERASDLEAEMTQLRAERDAAIRAHKEVLGGATWVVSMGNDVLSILRKMTTFAERKAHQDLATLPRHVRDLLGVYTEVIDKWEGALAELDHLVHNHVHDPATWSRDTGSHGASQS